MHKVVIDCDPGTDDFCAIVLAAQLVDVVGIVSVTGNVPIEHTTQNALFAAQFTGLDCPVVQGARVPLSGEPLFARHVHGKTGLGGLQLPELQRSLHDEDAVEFLIRMSHEHEALWLVAIGPLTNVALAVQADAGFAGRISGISIMGGSARVGNATPAAEFNFWADPEAADVVLCSGANIRLCGLNLTHQVLLDEAFVQRVAKLDATRLAPVQQILDSMLNAAEQISGRRMAPMHDPCSVAIVARPELFDISERHVQVELHGTHTRGMSVVDERTRANPQNMNVHLAYAVDDDALFELMYDAIASLE